jgi:hypothetical protein
MATPSSRFLRRSSLRSETTPQRVAIKVRNPVIAVTRGWTYRDESRSPRQRVRAKAATSRSGRGGAAGWP